MRVMKRTRRLLGSGLWVNTFSTFAASAYLREQPMSPFLRFASLVNHCMLPGVSLPPQARGRT